MTLDPHPEQGHEEIDAILRRHDARLEALEAHAHAEYAAVEHEHETAQPLYGRREGPREIAPFGVPNPIGDVVMGNHRLLAGEIFGGGAMTAPADGLDRPALRVFDQPDVTIADLECLGFVGIDHKNDGVVDVRWDSPRLTYHNVYVPTAPENGIEVVSVENIVRGVDISADRKVIAGHGNRHLLEDSRLRFKGTPIGADWGAKKLGRSYDGTARRVEFIGGVAWLDLGTAGWRYEHCLFAGSPRWGAHAEVANWEGQGGITTYWHCTFERNAWDRSNVNQWKQYGHLTAHLAPVAARYCEIVLNLNTENAITLLDGDNRADDPNHPGLTSAGSSVRDTLIRCSYDPALPLYGAIARLSHPDHISFANIVVQMPLDIPDEDVVRLLAPLMGTPGLVVERTEAAT